MITFLSSTSKNKNFLASATLVISIITLSCVRWGRPLERISINEGNIRIEEIIKDLRENDNLIKSLRGRGTFTLKTPQLDTVYQLHQSDIEFNHPDYLHAVGRKYTAVVLKLTCYKDEFLIELPTEKRYYYSRGGEYFEHSGAEATPLDIFREMLLTGDWDKIKLQSIELSKYDSVSQTAELIIYSEGNRTYPLRKIKVQGKPWVIIETERYSPTGTLIAKTNRSDYRLSEDGVKFPSVIQCEFPQENAFMGIKINKCVFNTPVKPSTTRLKKIVSNLIKEKYSPLELE
ncbi:MAG: hypothetical protein N3G21_09665 [Candidatus Hydrogenedentes bacterium]|nr:hypothetical protein [Candidatus Hydrogenedentota bacterium]